MSDYPDATKTAHVEKWAQNKDQSIQNYIVTNDDIINSNPATFTRWVKDYILEANQNIDNAISDKNNALKVVDSLTAENSNLEMRVRELELENEELRLKAMQATDDKRAAGLPTLNIHIEKIHDTTETKILQEKITMLETALRISDNAFQILVSR